MHKLPIVLVASSNSKSEKIKRSKFKRSPRLKGKKFNGSEGQKVKWSNGQKVKRSKSQKVKSPGCQKVKTFLYDIREPRYKQIKKDIRIKILVIYCHDLWIPPFK